MGRRRRLLNSSKGSPNSTPPESKPAPDGEALVESEAGDTPAESSEDPSESVEETAGSVEETVAPSEEAAASSEEAAASSEEPAASSEEAAASSEEPAASSEEAAASSGDVSATDDVPPGDDAPATEAPSTTEPLAASTVPEPTEGGGRQNLADTQIESEPLGDDIPASLQPTQPMAPRHEGPPGLATMETPIRPDRLPADFQETPMSADWYLKTGQPVPRRAEDPEAPAPEAEPAPPAASGPPWALIAGVVFVVGLLLCAGVWASL